MTDLIRQMHRKSRCRHDGRLTIDEARVDALAIEISAYCRGKPDPAAMAQSIRQGSAQMFGIPVKVD